MSQLSVRRVPPRLVRALKQRAAQAGRSAEAEHRVILEGALGDKATAVDIKSFLLAMPAPGRLSLRRSRDRGRRNDW